MEMEMYRPLVFIGLTFSTDLSLWVNVVASTFKSIKETHHHRKI